MNVLGGFALLLLIVAATVILLVAAIAAIRRDSSHGTSGTMSSAMLEVQSLLEPAQRHTIEAQRREKEEGDESGDD